LTVDLVLKNAKLHIPYGVVEAGLAIDDEKIVKIAKDVNLPSASEKMDVKGHLVLPGVIDAHVHLRDQELAYKEDFFSGTAAAATGGVTLTIDMPNNKPVTMSLESLKERMSIAREKSIVNVAFYSAFPNEAEEIPQIIREGGALGFKLFMSQQIGGINPQDQRKLSKALEETAKIGVPMAVHAENGKLLIDKKMKYGESEDLEDYLKVHSPEVEAEAVRHILQLSRRTGARIHFCHVSSAEGLEAISAAKKTGLPVTCEVTPHHLLISSRYLKRIGAVALADPPAREQQDVNELWVSLLEGVVDVLASDHAPHTIEEKMEKSIWRVKTGIPGLETMLPLLLTHVNSGRLDLPTLVRMTSENPSKIFGMRNRGDLKEGNYADLVVVNMKSEYKIDSSKFYSKAKYSPFDGWKVRGKPIKTFVNGRLVMDEGEICAKPGSGEIIRWLD